MHSDLISYQIFAISPKNNFEKRIFWPKTPQFWKKIHQGKEFLKITKITAIAYNMKGC
jgi:hypothetical protein